MFESPKKWPNDIVKKKSKKQVELERILELQLALYNLSSFLVAKGPIIYEGSRLQCALSDSKLRASQLVALGGAQSITTILNCSHWRGIPVRDLYPIARSVVESFINAAYVIAADEAVAERAVRWVRYRSWKENNRTAGSGHFSMTFKSMPDKGLLPEFAEFAEKGSAHKEWVKIDTASRIRVIGDTVSLKAGGRLLFAYTYIYGTSSEIIHGSPYGMNFFSQGHSGRNKDVSDYLSKTEQHVIDILHVVSNAIAGYLNVFFKHQKMLAPYIKEQEYYNQLLALDGISPQEVQREIE